MGYRVDFDKMIIHVLRQTAAEFTIRVACDKDPGYGQFFQLSLPKIGEAPISVCGKGPGYVEFTIRKVGRLTGGVFDLKAGDTLFMRNVVMVSEKKYNELLKAKRNAEYLAMLDKASAEAKAGGFIVKSLEELEEYE